MLMVGKNSRTRSIDIKDIAESLSPGCLERVGEARALSFQCIAPWQPGFYPCTKIDPLVTKAIPPDQPPSGLPAYTSKVHPNATQQIQLAHHAAEIARRLAGDALCHWSHRSRHEQAQVGIGSVWFEGNPCNMHLLVLSEKVKEGVTAAGLVGMRFNTIGVSDGISMAPTA